MGRRGGAAQKAREEIEADHQSSAHDGRPAAREDRKESRRDEHEAVPDGEGRAEPPREEAEQGRDEPDLQARDGDDVRDPAVAEGANRRRGQVLRLSHHEGEEERERPACFGRGTGEIRAKAPLHGGVGARHGRKRPRGRTEPFDLGGALEREARLGGQVEGRAGRAACLRQPQSAAHAHAVPELGDAGRVLLVPRP